MFSDARPVYCGPSGIRLHQIVCSRKQNNVLDYFVKRHPVYVHKGRTAIRLACEFLGLGPNAEILAPSYNCGSEIDALLSSGASVALYRITKSASVDLSDIGKRITSRTKAIYVTHYFGFPQDLTIIKNFCNQAGLSLIEDCALALFSSQNGEMIGTMGDVSIFSLPKTLPVPDGGIFLVNDAAEMKSRVDLVQTNLREIILSTLPLLKAAFLRWFTDRISYNRLCPTPQGWHCPPVNMHPAEKQSIRPGMPSNYYYDEQFSKRGISSLSKRLLERFVPNDIQAKRRKNYKMLDTILKNCPGMEPLFKELPEGICPLFFPVLVEKRDQIVSNLRSRSIDAKAWWKGFHRSFPWNDFPDACYLKDRLLALPVHQDLSDKDIAYVATSFRNLMFSC